MNYFWIIPISALILASVIGVGAIEYKVNTLIPLAVIEMDELKSMSCQEIKVRNSIGSYKLPDNGVFAREKVDACTDAEDAIKELERHKLNLLLADPNSKESLLKNLREEIKMHSILEPLFNEHYNQTKILSGNLTDIKNEIIALEDKIIIFVYNGLEIEYTKDERMQMLYDKDVHDLTEEEYNFMIEARKQIFHPYDPIGRIGGYMTYEEFQQFLDENNVDARGFVIDDDH